MRSARNPVTVSSCFHSRLNNYALAATAAGVTMLALAPLGEAEIIYKRANVHIVDNHSYFLDVNGDGTVDFTIGVGRGSSSGGFVLPDQTGNEVVLSARSNYFASALPRGAVIGSGANFGPPDDGGGWWMFRWFFSTPKFGNCWGPEWRNSYLGLKFMINGEIHYGWARMGDICSIRRQYTNLTGYAYETIPNQGIVAGEKKGEEEGEDESLNNELTPVPTPASLGMLATGASALKDWRQ
jgi:hypothetical protein